MNRRVCRAALVAALLVGAGCGGGIVTGSPAETGPNAAQEQGAGPDLSLPGDEAAASGGVRLMFYDERTVVGGVQRPTFTIATPRMTRNADGVITFEEATAVIVGRDGSESRLTAREGIFDETSKEARLAGGVILESGTLRVELSDIVWVNEERAARSEDRVTFVDRETRLDAATFEFLPEGDEKSPDFEVLNLTGVTGSLSLADVIEENGGGGAEQPGTDVVAEEAESAPGSEPDPLDDMSFDSMAIVALRVRMVSRRFDSFRGGVQIELSARDSDAAPMHLEAEEAVFSYDSAGEADPKSIVPKRIHLAGSVSVEGPMGAIAADSADCMLRDRSFQFDGNVSGAAPDIESFQTQALRYEPGLISLFGGVKVEGTDGAVQADEAALNKADGTTTFTGNVDVVRPDGTAIKADRAELNDEQKTMVFDGNVRGSLADIRDFSATRIVFRTDTGDGVINHLRARIDVAAGGEPESPTGLDLKAMRVRKAPTVDIVRRRVKTMRGGVLFELVFADPDDGVMEVHAAEAAFTYGADSGTMPDTVILTGGVRVIGSLGEINSSTAEMATKDKRFIFRGAVTGHTPEIEGFEANTLTYDAASVVLEGDVDVHHPEGHIRSDRAEMDHATKKMTFTGNVVADTPQLRGLDADELVYDPVAKRLVLDQAKIDEVTQHSGQEETGKEWLLSQEDVRDWPALLKAFKTPAPSVGARILLLLPKEPHDIEAAVRRLPTDRTPNATVQRSVVEELNRLIKNRDLYDEDSWRDVPLDEDVRDLLGQERQSLSSREVIRLNRRLIEAAYPDAIEPRATGAAASSVQGE